MSKKEIEELKGIIIDKYSDIMDKSLIDKVLHYKWSLADLKWLESHLRKQLHDCRSNKEAI
jgi:hypothetical protein